MYSMKIYLKTILQIFESHNLDYCIQNNYEEMPEKFPSDIDIFYRNASEKDLDYIVQEAAKETGLLVIQKLAMGYKQFVYWLSPNLPESGFQLELDFQAELSKLSIPHYYIPDKLLDRKRIYHGFYIPSQLDEIIYTILRRTVKHDFTEKHLATLLSDYNSDPNMIEIGLHNELPNKVAEKIINLIKSNDICNFERYYPIFKEYVLIQSSKHNTIRKKILQWRYNISRMLPLRFIHPVGMDIALIAPDGGGKSTILKALKTYKITSFVGVERKYVRPGLFKNIGQYKPNAKPEENDNPDPHGREPDCILKSWIRFLIYLIDFTVGYLICVIPLKWQRKLVVFDRYYYDYYVDMYRYHYSLPKWVPRFFSFIIPRPTITFVLHASPQVIYNRKKELTMDETERQCDMFRRLSQTLPNAKLINVDRPINKIVDEIVEIIIKKRAELTKKKMKI